jgi:hypothetical protein
LGAGLGLALGGRRADGDRYKQGGYGDELAEAASTQWESRYERNTLLRSVAGRANRPR